MSKNKKQDIPLDHDYDGIQELDNDLPPWWLYLFYITIIWAVVYMLHYHVFGTGDSSYAEYMKEIDPQWVAEKEAASFSIGYDSPFYTDRPDLTPYVRRVLATMEAEARAAQMASGLHGIKEDDLGELGFETLISAAMRVSSAEDLEKLKTAFPGIWSQLDTQQDAGSPPASAVAEPEPEIDPFTDEVSLAAGNEIFQLNCATCHGKLGEGGIGPNMTDDYFLHGRGMNSTVRLIRTGVPAKGMIAWRGILKEEQILQVASHILTLPGTNPANAKAPQGEQILASETNEQ